MEKNDEMRSNANDLCQEQQVFLFYSIRITLAKKSDFSLELKAQNQGQ